MNISGDNNEEEQPFEMNPEGEKSEAGFCLLLWAYNGGQVGPNGPIFSSRSSPSIGYCAEPTDCFSCPLMQQEMAKHPPGTVNWVCPSCIPEVIKLAKEKGISIHIPGHYTEGQCQFVNCSRGARTEEVPQHQEVPVGYSRLLQLIVGDINS